MLIEPQGNDDKSFYFRILDSDMCSHTESNSMPNSLDQTSFDSTIETRDLVNESHVVETTQKLKTSENTIFDKLNTTLNSADIKAELNWMNFSPNAEHTNKVLVDLSNTNLIFTRILDAQLWPFYDKKTPSNLSELDITSRSERQYVFSLDGSQVVIAEIELVK